MKNLVDMIDVKELQELQDAFATATGLAAVVLDVDGKPVTTPSNYTDFCMKYTRSSPVGSQRCERCDTDGTDLYVCHLGLMDFSEPIIIDGVQYGRIWGGQVLPAPPDYDKFRQAAQQMGIPEDEYLSALSRVPVRPEEAIRASVKLLQYAIATLIDYHQVSHQDQFKIDVLEDEIDSMIARAKGITSKTRELQRVSTKQRLLSINAAIEAGRAGDAGKGFKIVADQMGELAEMSSEMYETLVDDANVIHTSVKNLSSAFKIAKKR